MGAVKAARKLSCGCLRILMTFILEITATYPYLNFTTCCLQLIGLIMVDWQLHIAISLNMQPLLLLMMMVTMRKTNIERLFHSLGADFIQGVLRQISQRVYRFALY